MGLGPYKAGKPPAARLFRRREVLAGVLQLGAAAAHGGLAPEHLAEWWGYGLFFLAAAGAQAVLGLALVTRAVNERDAGPSWWRLRRAMLLAGVVGNLLILTLYAVTRTVGIPWFGPSAGEVEAVAPIDLLTGAAEAVSVALLALLLRSSWMPPASEPPRG